MITTATTPSIRDKRKLATIAKAKVKAAAAAAMQANGGLLRLAPCWVPRSFLQPGQRLKLDPKDLFAFGLDRGGIDERWFGSTTEAANDNRTPDEGLSYVVHDGARFTLRDAIAALGADIIGDRLWKQYGKWPVYSKFFDNMGPIPHHMHHDFPLAEKVGQQGKPEAYYFPPQHNNVENNFAYTFFGLNPGTTKEQVRQCLRDWNKGDNGLLDLSAAYRLRPGTGWLVGPGILHAPGSLCTYEPQWGSDVFGMYQNLVEGRAVPWDLLVKDVPKDKKQDIDYIVDQLDWDSNVDPNFKANHHLQPIPVADTADQGYVDRWIVYGKVNGKQYFTAKELTVDPGTRCTITDKGANSVIVVQGEGWMNKMRISSPKMIGFNELTEDEVFVSEKAAKAGITFENTSSTEPLVLLRYFGPDVNPDAPQVGDYLKPAKKK
jgi:hypothetical protein